MQDIAADTTLYVHTLRPQWGMAILTEVRPTKRRYLFQDGQTRLFQERFFHLIQPADKPSEIVRQVGGRLRAQIGAGPDERSVLGHGQMDPVPLDAQLDAFRAVFPGGFLDPDYLHAHRSGRSGKRLKRHVDGVIELAGATLGAGELAALAEAERWDEIHSRASAVVEATTLCTPKQRKAVTEIPPDRHADFGRALARLLHAEGSSTEPFTRLTTLLHDETEATWGVATLFPGLLFPHEHVVVDPWPFAKQARRLEPQLVVGHAPNALVYERLRDMAQRLSAELADRGLPPQDLMDVHAFIVETLRPDPR